MLASKMIGLMPNFIKKKIENNQDVNRILGNINWLTFENILRSLIGLVIFAWIARYLGPEKFGLMNYIYAFVMLFSSIANMGLDSILIREVINKESKERGVYLGSALLLKTIGAIISIILSASLIVILKPQDNFLLMMILIVSSMYIFKIFDVIDFWFQSQILAKYSVLARSIAFVLVTGLKILFILFDLPLQYFIGMFAFEALLTAVFLIFFYNFKKENILKSWSVSFDVVKKLFKDSWPLILGGIASLVYMKIDQVMIGQMLANDKVGIYYSAVKLSETWYFVPAIIGASVFPAILNAKKKSESLYLKRLQILFDMAAWFGIIIALVISITSPFIISVLYGQSYISAAPVLAVHIWSGVFVFLGVIASKWVIAENYTKNALLRTALGAVLNVVLNLLLLPLLGIMGAAISTLISYSFVNYFSLVLSPQTRICFRMQSNAFNIFRILKIKTVIRYVKYKCRYVYWLLFYNLTNIFSKNIGVNISNSKEKKIIITLTSYPKRYDVVHLTLESLLNQTMKPDKIVLWISDEEKCLPNKVLKLQARGVDIKYVPGNIKSYKKLLYALKEFPNDLLITVDDDSIYPREFVRELYDNYLLNKNCIVANRCTLMSFDGASNLTPYISWKSTSEVNPSLLQFPTGVGGILYPPESLNKEVFNEEVFMNICPSADDVWFKAMGILNNTKTYYTGKEERYILTIKKAQKTSLWQVNVLDNKNDIQIKAVFEKYKLLELLKDEK